MASNNPNLDNSDIEDKLGRTTCFCCKKKLPTTDEINSLIIETQKDIQTEKKLIDSRIHNHHGSFSGKAFITFKKVRDKLAYQVAFH